MKIEAVVFDMDGLMFDTEGLWLRGVEKTNSECGYNVPLELIIKCIGHRKDKIDIMLKNTLGQDFNTEKFRELNRKYMDEEIASLGLKKKKGLDELLEFLYGKNIKVAIASSSSFERVHSRLQQAGVSDKYFDKIVGGNMVTEPKPAPDIYLIACRELGVNPENTLALEDSDAGILSAHLAGLKPILIPDIKTPKPETEKIAYRKFNDLSEVISLFE